MDRRTPARITAPPGGSPGQLDAGQAPVGLAPTPQQDGEAGFGRPISRRRCRMMGGDITVESASGHGSIFTIRLPAEAPRVTAAHDARSP